MAVKGADLESELIDTVCERVRERLPAGQVAPCEAFVRQYYQWVPAEDLADRNPLDLYGAAVAHYNLAQQRAPGEAKVRVYNPDFEQHGWQSPHTLIEIVSDDMPFIVDSVTMQLGRLGYGIDLVIHPVMRVRRDADGHLIEVLDPEAIDADGAIRESILHAEVGREHDRVLLDQLRTVDRARPGRRPRRRRGLATHGRAHAGADRRVRFHAAAERRPVAHRGDQGVPGVAGRGQLHVHRVPRVRPDRRGRRGPHATDRGVRTRDPQDATDQGAQEARRQGTRRRSRAADPAPDQGQLPVADPSPRVPRLHRRQEVLRRRPGHRRASLHRPLHDARVQGEPALDPDHPRQGRRRARAGRVPAGEPRPQGPPRDPRVLHARLAVPDGDRGSVQPGDRRPRARRAPAPAAVPVARPARPLRRVPGVHPARSLQHRESRTHRQDPDGGARGRGPRLDAPAERVAPGPGALHHPARRGPRHRVRRRDDRDPPRPGDPRLDRRAPRGPDRRVR